jgi:hypothetical protein
VVVLAGALPPPGIPRNAGRCRASLAMAFCRNANDPLLRGLKESGMKRGDKRGHAAFAGTASLTLEKVFIFIDVAFLFQLLEPVLISLFLFLIAQSFFKIFLNG